MSANKGNMNLSQETSQNGLSVGSRSLKQWLLLGRLYPWPPKPAALPHCPASLPDFLPSVMMLSVFLVLPLILFFKG